MTVVGRENLYVPPDNPDAEPQTISIGGTAKAPKNREESIVVKDGMRYKKIVEFPLPNRYILIGPVEAEKKVEVNPFQCKKCGFVAKTNAGLCAHGRKHPPENIVKF